ncbi:MAG: hypothetical protein ACOC1F_09400 [Myxococcota bacterium]
MSFVLIPVCDEAVHGIDKVIGGPEAIVLRQRLHESHQVVCFSAHRALPEDLSGVRVERSEQRASTVAHVLELAPSGLAFSGRLECQHSAISKRGIKWRATSMKSNNATNEPQIRLTADR